MMHVRLAVTAEQLRARAIEIAESDGIFTFGRPFQSDSPRWQRCELSVGDATLGLPAAEIRLLFERLVGGTRP